MGLDTLSGMATPPSPETTVFMHIGPPKTGTTYLQGVLRYWHKELRAAGVLFPAVPTLDHFNAALDLRGDHAFGIGSGRDAERPRAHGAWDRLVGVTKGHDGVVVLSHELFATAGDTAAARAVRDLRDTDLHIVVTARDPARQMVSAWQERIKHGGTRRFTRVSRRVAGNGLRGTVQDLESVLARWAALLPADHIHVVTVPPAGADPALLWRRFAAVIGVQPTAVDPARAPYANESLGSAEIELLRRVNEALAGRIAHPAYAQTVTKLYANGLLAGARSSGAPTLPRRLWAGADAIADTWVTHIEQAGYDVSGDLGDLRPQHRRGDRSGSATSEQEVAQAAVAATAELLVAINRMTDPSHAVRLALRTTARRVGYATLSAGQRLRYRTSRVRHRG